MSERAPGRRAATSERRTPLPELTVDGAAGYELDHVPARTDYAASIPASGTDAVVNRTELFAARYAELMARTHTSYETRALIEAQFESLQTPDGREIPPLLRVEVEEDASGKKTERVVAASPEAVNLLYEADRQVRLEAVREKLPSLEALVDKNPHEAEARIAHAQDGTYGPKHNPLATKHEYTSRDGKSRRKRHEHHPGVLDLHDELKNLRDQARERIQAADRKAAVERAREQAEAAARAEAAAYEREAERLRNEQAATRAEIMAAVDRDRGDAKGIGPGQGGVAMTMFDRAPDVATANLLADHWVAKKVLARDAETGRLIMPARAGFDAGLRFTAETALQRYGAAMERLASDKPEADESLPPEHDAAPADVDAAYRQAFDRIAHYAPLDPDDAAEADRRLAEFSAASEAARTSDELGRIMALAFGQQLVQRRHDYDDTAAAEADHRITAVHFDGASPELTDWFARTKYRYDAIINRHHEPSPKQPSPTSPSSPDKFGRSWPDARQEDAGKQGPSRSEPATFDEEALKPREFHPDYKAYEGFEARIPHEPKDLAAIRALADEAVREGLIKRDFKSSASVPSERYRPNGLDDASSRLIDRLTRAYYRLEAARLDETRKARAAEAVARADGPTRRAHTSKPASRHAPIYRYQYEHHPAKLDEDWKRRWSEPEAGTTDDGLGKV